MSDNLYHVTVSLDGDWTGRDAVVRAVHGDGYTDYEITNGSVDITIPGGISEIAIGVYSGRLATTNRAVIHVLPSILTVTEDSSEVAL